MGQRPTTPAGRGRRFGVSGGRKRDRPKGRLTAFLPPGTALLVSRRLDARLTTNEVPSSQHESERITGWELKRLRDRFFAADPLCAGCRRQGRVRRWDELDHIVPLREGGTNDDSNLQGLCFECHAAKSAEEQRRALRVRHAAFEDAG